MNAAAVPASARDVADARHDRHFRWLLTATAVFVLVTLAGAALSMLWGGRSVLASEGLGFFFSTDWNPVENKYGALVPIYGTVVTAIIAMLIAVPVSFGIAFFLTEVAPRWMRTPVGTAIELLAGIPSIIYGMWGFFVLMPVMREHLIPWLNDNVGPLPVIGPLAQIATQPSFNAAATYALGKVFQHHFAAGGNFQTFDTEKLKSYFQSVFDDARRGKVAWA